MAGLKIMLAIVLCTITVAFFFPMFADLVAPRDGNGILGLIVWLVIFALAALAVNAALPKRRIEADHQ